MPKILDHAPALLLLGRCMLVYEYLITTDVLFNGRIARMAEISAETGRMPELLVYVGVLIKLVGSVLIIVGFQTSAAALLLVLFTIVATVQYHDYWNIVPDDTNAGLIREQSARFAKNVCMTGGLLVLAAVGAGRWSLDHWLASRRGANA